MVDIIKNKNINLVVSRINSIFDITKLNYDTLT
jgi:hypothetical protein